MPVTIVRSQWRSDKSFFLCVYLRTIDVSNATLTYQIENLPKNQFEICTPGRVYSLQASSREAMFYWLEALQVHVWMLHMTSLRGHPEYTVEINTLLSYVASFLSPGFGCLLYARAKEQAEELLSHELCQCLQMGGGTPDRKTNLFSFCSVNPSPGVQTFWYYHSYTTKHAYSFCILFQLADFSSLFLPKYICGHWWHHPKDKCSPTFPLCFWAL